MSNIEKKLISNFGSGTLGILILNWLTIAVGILRHFKYEAHMAHDQTHLEDTAGVL